MRCSVCNRWEFDSVIPYRIVHDECWCPECDVIITDSYNEFMVMDLEKEFNQDEVELSTLSTNTQDILTSDQSTPTV